MDAATADLVKKHGYSGSDVVEENVRQLCLFRELQRRNDTAAWWRYSVRHSNECAMTRGAFDRPCAEGIMAGSENPDGDGDGDDASFGLGFDPAAIARVRACVGDLDADVANRAMDAELRLQADQDDSGRGAVVLLPTVVINLNQYRGRLSGKDVLRALCAGFAEATAPEVCLSGTMEPNECERPGNAGCWSLAVPADAAASRRRETTPRASTRSAGARACARGLRGRRRDLRGRRRVRRREPAARLRADVRERNRRLPVRVSLRVQARWRRVLLALWTRSRRVRGEEAWDGRRASRDGHWSRWSRSARSARTATS